MALSFNGVTKVITLGSGDDSLSVRDLWSRWVDWWLTSDNSKYEMAMANVGGNVIDAGAGTIIPVYVFLQNGWKIKPDESDHTLNVGDGVLLVEGGGDPFNDTDGDYVVRINYQQPVQAISFSTEGGGGGGLTAAQVWQRNIEDGLSAEEILRIFAAILVNNAEGLMDGDFIFKSRDGTKNRVVGTQVDGVRTITSIDPS